MFGTEKGAEAAFVDANIRVVDVAVNDECNCIAGMKFLANFIGHLTELENVAVPQKVNGFCIGKSCHDKNLNKLIYFISL